MNFEFWVPSQLHFILSEFQCIYLIYICVCVLNFPQMPWIEASKHASTPNFPLFVSGYNLTCSPWREITTQDKVRLVQSESVPHPSYLPWKGMQWQNWLRVRGNTSVTWRSCWIPITNAWAAAPPQLFWKTSVISSFPTSVTSWTFTMSKFCATLNKDTIDSSAF